MFKKVEKGGAVSSFDTVLEDEQRNEQPEVNIIKKLLHGNKSKAK